MDSLVTPVTQVPLLESAGLVAIPASRGSLLIRATVVHQEHLAVIRDTQAILVGRGSQAGQASQVRGFLVTVASRVLQVSLGSLDTAGAAHFLVTAD